MATPDTAVEQNYTLEFVSGVEGPHLALMNRTKGYGLRLVGPKAWGGGTTLHSWKVNPTDLIRDIAREVGIDLRAHDAASIQVEGPWHKGFPQQVGITDQDGSTLWGEMTPIRDSEGRAIGWTGNPDALLNALASQAPSPDALRALREIRLMAATGAVQTADLPTIVRLCDAALGQQQEASS